MSSILVVDDEKDLCDLMAESLEDIGHFVLTATGGHEAIHLMAKHDFDLIISDLKMANGDGHLILNNLNNFSSKRPEIIFITGFLGNESEVLLQKGARAVYQKPLNFDEFFKSIDQILV